MTEVLLSERSRDRLAALESEIQERIEDSLRDLVPDRDLSRLSGEELHALRVGDYRVIVEWDRGEDTVYVLTVGHRRNVYDRYL